MPFAIGIENLKREVNLGTLLRSAFNFEAAMVFTVGPIRYKRQGADTTATPRHIPVMHFDDWDHAFNSWPCDWIPIAVEIKDHFLPLPQFKHPESAVYLLGPEDGCLSSNVISRCKFKIAIPSKYCLNVSVAGSIVMYDRIVKTEHK